MERNTMTSDEALALLKRLEQEHGAGILAVLLGAGWRDDETANHAEMVKEGETDCDLSLWLREATEDQQDWLNGFIESEDFHRGTGNL